MQVLEEQRRGFTPPPKTRVSGKPTYEPRLAKTRVNQYAAGRGTEAASPARVGLHGGHKCMLSRSRTSLSPTLCLIS